MGGEVPESCPLHDGGVAPDTPGGVRVRGFCDGGEVRRPLGVGVHKVDAEVPDVAEQLGQLPHGPSASGSSLNYTDMLIVQSRETWVGTNGRLSRRRSLK